MWENQEKNPIKELVQDFMIENNMDISNFTDLL